MISQKTNSRLHITLSPETRNVLHRISLIESRPMSKIAGGLLEEMLPVLEKTVVMMEQAFKLKDNASQQLRYEFNERAAFADHTLEKIVDLFDETSDAFTDALKDQK